MKEDVWHEKTERVGESPLVKCIRDLTRMRDRMMKEAKKCREEADKIRAIVEEGKRG
jgi:hypothetical protein